LNVKALTFGAAEVQLDTQITEELRLEGLARDLVRTIQSLRKESGYQIEDRIVTYWETIGFVAHAFEVWAQYIKTETLSVDLIRGIPPEQGGGPRGGFAEHGQEGGSPPSRLDGKEVTIDGEKVWLALKRVD